MKPRFGAILFGSAPVDGTAGLIYMRDIPNAFWVPAPFASAWDFLRFP